MHNALLHPAKTSPEKCYDYKRLGFQYKKKGKQSYKRHQWLPTPIFFKINQSYFACNNQIMGEICTETTSATVRNS